MSDLKASNLRCKDRHKTLLFNLDDIITIQDIGETENGLILDVYYPQKKIQLAYSIDDLELGLKEKDIQRIKKTGEKR